MSSHPLDIGHVPEFLRAAPEQPPGIDATLAQRGERYGVFFEQARLTQRLKEVLQSGSNWPTMNDDAREALEMIVSKIARILNGDPEYVDNWHDIEGYALLIEKRLTTKETV